MSSTDNFYKFEDFLTFCKNITYSDHYIDDLGIKYRHVIIPKQELLELLRKYTKISKSSKGQNQAFVVTKIVEKLIKGEFLSEEECKLLGLQISEGWQHYIFLRDPFVMGFRYSAFHNNKSS